MRTFYCILILMMLLACKHTESFTIAITVMADRTDTITIDRPNVLLVKSLSDLVNDPTNGIDFRFQHIGNTDFNPVFNAKLKPSSFLDNSLERKVAIAHFYKDIYTLFKSENKRIYSYTSSSILIPLVAQLKKLQQLDASKKVLVLYSDGYECSSLFNVYGTDRTKLLSNTKLVAEKLKVQLQLPDALSDVTLYLIYNPSTPEDNKLFSSVCKLYLELFKDSGLNIRIGMEQKLQQ